MEIIRGTTPTIIFTFNLIDVTDITVAYLIFTQNNTEVLEKSISDAVVEDEKLCFTLSQEDTLSLSASSKASFSLDWKLANGTRGRSNIYETNIGNSGKDEVI